MMKIQWQQLGTYDLHNAGYILDRVRDFSLLCHIHTYLHVIFHLMNVYVIGNLFIAKFCKYI